MSSSVIPIWFELVLIHVACNRMRFLQRGARSTIPVRLRLQFEPVFAITINVCVTVLFWTVFCQYGLLELLQLRVSKRHLRYLMPSVQHISRYMHIASWAADVCEWNELLIELREFYDC